MASNGGDGGQSAPSPAASNAPATTNGTARATLDFNKLFQSGGGASKASATNGTAADATASLTTKAPSNQSTPASINVVAADSAQNSPSTARSQAQPSPAANRPGPNAAPRTPSQAHGPYSAGGNAMPRLGSSHNVYGSGGGGNGQQQPRSPQMAGAQLPGQHQMAHMNNGQWQGQPHMYYGPMYQSYNYGGVAPPMHGQQFYPGQGFEGGMPHSPRHLPGVGGSQSGTSNGPATPGLPSPASSHRSVPQTPTSINSPAGHQIGIGHPTGRPGGYQGNAMGTAGFNPHSPSHTFSASARQFEPSQVATSPLQKRTSSAIRIVNPNTLAAVEFKPAAKKEAPSTPATPTPAATASVATPAPAAGAEADSPAPAKSTAPFDAAALRNSTPTTPSAPAPTKPAASQGANATTATSTAGPKLATSEDFMMKVKALAEQAKQQKKEKLAAEAAAAAAATAADGATSTAKTSVAEGDVAKKGEAEDAKSVAEQSQQPKTVSPPTQKAEESEAKQPTTTDKASVADAAPSAASDVSAVGTQESKFEDASKATEAESKSSAADVERMAREASSVPSTPLEANASRAPTTPRTPGTPGFANLPAKPLSSTGANVASPTITREGDGEEQRADVDGEEQDSNKAEAEPSSGRRKATPSHLDIASAQQSKANADAPPMSAASAALGSARFIDDFSKIQYPDKIQSPRAGLNEAAEPGKFRYDRDFLLQFMGVYKEKPSDLPSLASIGMDGSQAAGARGSAGRRPSGMGPPAAPGRGGSIGLGLGGSGFGKGGMGQFSHPAKTSEERFAASNSRGGVGSFGSSGPMGAFNAGARSQPLSRTGSGSNAVPTREAMGTGIPNGGRAGSRRGKDRRDPGRSGVNPPEKGGPTIPMDQVVPLANSENRWVGNRGQNVKPDSPDLVTRKVKALLNKLTLERFDSISMQILEWANKSVDEKDGQTLRIVIALIFEKATDEAAWSEMYATLCRKIMEKLDPNIQDENIKTGDDKPVMGGHLFRKYLVNRCQEDFERGWAQRDATAAAAKSKEAEDLAKKASNEKAAAAAKEAEARGEKAAEDSKEAELLSDEYYEAQKAKRRGLGLVRFIGELFKFQMLTEKIMHLCLQKLLTNATTPEEEEVESLCKLLTTVGKLLDEGKARSYVDVYFQRMDEMMNHAAMTQRMKFMLQDVIELRQHQWKPRHDNSAPKTIAQIHEDAAKAKQQAEYDRARNFMGGSMSRGGSRRGQQRDQFGADGFITVGSNQPPPPAHQTKAGNLSGFGKGIDRSGGIRPFSGGPQSVFARKNQKSDDGSNPPSRTASSQNIFSLLSSNADASDPMAATIEERTPAASGRPKLNLAKRTKPLPGSEGAEEGGEDEQSDDDDDEDEQQQDDEDGEITDELSAEEAARKIDNDIKEFMEIKNVEEGTLALQSLPLAHRAEFVNKVVELALNQKEEQVRLVGCLFQAAHQQGLLTDEVVEKGVKDHVEYLDDVAIDVPNAYSYMAILLHASGLSRDKIETLAGTIQGEGVKSPRDRLMAKVDEQ